MSRMTGLSGMHPSAAHVLAGAVFAVAGAYQLSRLIEKIWTWGPVAGRLAGMG